MNKYVQQNAEKFSFLTWKNRKNFGFIDILYMKRE